jgi:CHAD domain-containing protein
MIEMSVPVNLQEPGIQPSDSLAEAGKKIWSYHFSAMLSQEEGTRLGKDPEALHDMRVATRRMRAAFDVFGQAFKAKTLKPHLNGLRATGRALGKVRDLDVFIEKARLYLDQLPESDQHDLDPLLESWSNQRENARVELLAYLDSDIYKNFKEAFSSFLEKPERLNPDKTDNKAKEPQKEIVIPQPYQIRHLAPVMIYQHAAEVRCFDTILESASLEQHHALRIQFKKFRYTVEFFKEILGPEANAVISDLKKMQDHLGDLNDASVAAVMLKDTLDNWQTEQIKLPLIQRTNSYGTMRYLSYRLRERDQLLKSFPETWKWFKRDDFRKNLALAVAIL